MEINRNQYFLAGLVILLLGVQFRMVESYVLNEQASEYLQERYAENEFASRSNPLPLFLAAASPPTRQMLHPPAWLGWACLSAGIVLVLHSLAMKKPGG